MTARHTDRCGDLRKNIKWCHNRDRSCKSLHISTETICLNLLCRDHGKYNNCPCSFCGKICCRASQSYKADQVGYHTGGKKRRHKRNHIAEFLTHISDDEFICCLHQKLSHSLSPGYFLHLQIMCQPDTKSCDQQHNQPAYNQSLRDLEFPQDGNLERKRIEYPATGYFDIHVLSPPVIINLQLFRTISVTHFTEQYLLNSYIKLYISLCGLSPPNDSNCLDHNVWKKQW